MYETMCLEDTGDLKNRIKTIIDSTSDTLPEKKGLYIGVPGGRSVSHIISAMMLLDDALLIRIYLVIVDERLRGEKNIDTIMDAGIQRLIEEGRFLAEHVISTQQANTSLDLVFLGVGEDGHVASLFPGSFPSLAGDDTSVITTINDSPKPPSERRTITYQGFSKLSPAARYILLFLGEAKKDALKRFIAGESPTSLPSAFFRDTMGSVTIITDIREVES